MTDADVATEALLAAWDKAADEWMAANAAIGLDQIFAVSQDIAGSRLQGPGGASLKMLLLRQRALVKRWVHEAFVEGQCVEWYRHPIDGEEQH